MAAKHEQGSERDHNKARPLGEAERFLEVGAR